MAHCTLSSPLGPLTLSEENGVLTELTFGGVVTETPLNPILCAATAQLVAYFSGRLHAFTVPLAPKGTPFQMQVWAALLKIPYGETCSYGEIARRIGNPKAMRAVGMANNRNPISILIPCHRVIGQNGQLTGYGGGLPHKEWLLRHEAATK